MHRQQGWYNDEATAWSQERIDHWVDEDLYKAAAVDVTSSTKHAQRRLSCTRRS